MSTPPEPADGRTEAAEAPGHTGSAEDDVRHRELTLDEAIPAEEVTTASALALSPRAQRIANRLVAVCAVVGVAWFVWANWDDITETEWTLRIPTLIASLACYLLSEAIRPFIWLQMMHSAGERPPWKGTAFVWFAVEPTQYLPVAVGPFVGRYALAERVGLPPVVAIVTLAYEYAMGMLVAVGIAFPGLVWIAFFKATQYRWTVALIAAFFGVFAFALLRRGGLSRTIADMLEGVSDPRKDGSVATRASAEVAAVDISRRSLVLPAILTAVAFGIRITGAGLLLSSLLPAPLSPLEVPLYGLVFAAGATMPFGRFGVREAFIVAGFTALGVAPGVATVAAIASRAIGLATALVLLGVSALIGGGRRVTARAPSGTARAGS